MKGLPGPSTLFYLVHLQVTNIKIFIYKCHWLEEVNSIKSKSQNGFLSFSVEKNRDDKKMLMWPPSVFVSADERVKAIKGKRLQGGNPSIK
jgi:hypothetical protein